MAAEAQPARGQWSSRLTFVLAATGSAVGLGNIWKFPYMAGEQGGALFVLIYLICVLCIGIPLLMAEVLMGRRGGHNLVASMRALGKEAGARGPWPVMGWTMASCGVLILSFYSVIGGWTIAYILEMFRLHSDGLGAVSAASAFSELTGHPGRSLLWHTVFMLLTTVVVARGVRRGLEKAVQILMPLLLALLVFMVVYAASLEGFAQGVKHMFVADFDKFADPEAGRGIALAAIGQAFFSLSLGMGAIMIYGSYLPGAVSIPGAVLAVGLLDTLVALLAGLVIFPIVFSYGLALDSGPSLVFISMPVAFGIMPYGLLVGVLFFTLLLVAAWSSSISLLEPAVNLLHEKKILSRSLSAWAAGLLTWLLGIATVLSFNKWAFGFTFLGKSKENGIFDMLDILTSQIMLPVHGLLLGLFVFWVMKRSHCMEELNLGSGALFQTIYGVGRYLAPFAIILIIINSFLA